MVLSVVVPAAALFGSVVLLLLLFVEEEVVAGVVLRLQLNNKIEKEKSVRIFCMNSVFVHFAKIMLNNFCYQQFLLITANMEGAIRCIKKLLLSFVLQKTVEVLKNCSNFLHLSVFQALHFFTSEGVLIL